MKYTRAALRLLVSPLRAFEWLLERLLGTPDPRPPATFDEAAEQRDEIQKQLDRSKNITTGT